MEKIEFYYNTNKHFCWECMKWFEFDGGFLDLKECPKCHIKIENKDDISINLDKITREDRNKMFSIIYNSECVLGIDKGFDILDAELLIELIKGLTLKRRKELFLYFHDDYSLKIFDFVDSHWEYDKAILWSETFKRLSKKKQNNFIIEYFEYYIKSIYVSKYDWTSFKCNLFENNELSKLEQITNNWNELGMQVYGCRLSNHQLCPCLKESATGGSFKCFKEYLKSKGLRPDADVPLNLRID